MIVKEYVAFQTVDKEWGTWCNKAFFFETIEEAEVFFSDVSNIMDALGLELEEDDDYIMETIEEVQALLKYIGVNGNLMYLLVVSLLVIR